MLSDRVSSCGVQHGATTSTGRRGTLCSPPGALGPIPLGARPSHPAAPHPPAPPPSYSCERPPQPVAWGGRDEFARMHISCGVGSSARARASHHSAPNVLMQTLYVPHIAQQGKERRHRSGARISDASTTPPTDHTLPADAREQQVPSPPVHMAAVGRCHDRAATRVKPWVTFPAPPRQEPSPTPAPPAPLPLRPSPAALQRPHCFGRC